MAKQIKIRAIKQVTTRGRLTKSGVLRDAIVGVLRDEWVGEETNNWHGFERLAADLNSWAINGCVDCKMVKREVHRLGAAGVLEHGTVMNDDGEFGGSGYFLTYDYATSSPACMAAAPYCWVEPLRALYGFYGSREKGAGK
jgi:hypothetical protein